MECQNVRTHLIRYLDNDLPDGICREIEDHLDHCYLCIEELNATVALLDTCRDALRHPTPRNRYAALRERLRGPARAPVFPYRRKHVFLKLLAAAAVLLLIISLGEPAVRTARAFTTLIEYVAVQEYPTPAAEFESRDMPVLMAWGYRISWAESLSTHPAPTEPALESQEEPPNREHDAIPRTVSQERSDALDSGQTGTHVQCAA